MRRCRQAPSQRPRRRAWSRRAVPPASCRSQTVHNPPTIADGVRTPYLGQYTFPLVLHYVDDMQTVSEEAIKEAVRFFFYRMKLVVEPSGALGLAALLSGAVPVQGQRVGVVISGGNIDGEMMAEILRSRIED
ncbi:MAG: pyridoxal-phosphate dependent enzyme [Caldilineaceae bacterium]